MTSEKQFFIHLQNKEKKHQDIIVELFSEYKDQKSISNRVLRKLVQLVLADILKEVPLLPTEEARTWLENQASTIELHNPLYKQYIFASLNHQEPALKQIRNRLNNASMDFGYFAAQRYIHSASIDIQDWETAALLHGKLSQFIGNNDIEDKAASPKTLAILRTRLEKKLHTLSAQNQLNCFLEILKNPYPRTINEDFQKRNVAFENLFFGHDAIRWTHQRLDQTFGKDVQYCTKYNSFQFGTTQRSEIFSQLSSEQIDTWIATFASLRNISKQFALRILSHCALSKEQRENIYQAAQNTVPEDLGVFLLLQLGWTKTTTEEEIFFSPPQGFVYTEEFKKAVRCLISTKETSEEQVLLLHATLQAHPALVLYLFSELTNSPYQNLVLSILPELPLTASIKEYLPVFIAALDNEHLSMEWRKNFNHILYSRFIHDLFVLPESLLLTYLDSSIPNIQNKTDIIEHRDITLTCTNELISFCMSHTIEPIRKSFAQHLKKHPITTYQTCSESLLKLFFSPYQDVQNFFDVHVLDILKRFTANIEHSLTMTWLAYEGEQFVQFGDRFHRGLLGEALKNIAQDEPETVLTILERKVPTKSIAEAECIVYVLELIPSASTYAHKILNKIIRTHRKTVLRQWSQKILSAGCLDKNTSCIDLLNALIIDSFHNTSILSYIKTLESSVFQAWYTNTASQSFNTTMDAFREKIYWLVAYVFPLFSYDQVKTQLGAFLQAPDEQIQQAFTPFLEQTLEKDALFLGETIAYNIQNLYLQAATKQKSFIEHLRLPNLYAKTYTYVKPALFSNINVLAPHPILRELLLSYLNVAPQDSLIKEPAILSLLNAQYDDVREFAWKWLCDHLPDHIDFFGDNFFAQLHLLHNLQGSDIRKARAQEIYNLTEDYFDVFVPHHQPKVFALANTALLEQSNAHSYFIYLSVELLSHLPQEIWRTNQKFLLQLVLSHRSEVYTRTTPLLLNALEDSEISESIALRFFDNITSMTMHDQSHRAHCLSLFEKYISKPLKEIILRAPAQYLSKVKQFISSEERTIQDIGVSLLKVIPVDILIQKEKLVHWLLFHSPLHLLKLILQKISTAVHETTHNLVPFTTRVFNTLTKDENHTERFQSTWSELFDLFTPTLSIIQNTDQDTYNTWLDRAQSTSPYGDLHWGLFAALSPQERERQVDHFLSFFRSTILLNKFTTLFDGVKAAPLLPQIMRYKNLNYLTDDKLLWFFNNYEAEIQSFLNDIKNVDVWRKLFKKTRTEVDTYHLTTQRVFPFLSPAVVQQDSKLRKLLVEHNVLLSFPTFKEKLKQVFSPDFLSTNLNATLSLIKRNRNLSIEDERHKTIILIFTTAILPALEDTETNSGDTLDILQDMLDSSLLAQHIFPIFLKTPTEELLRRPKLQDLLWKGETEQARTFSVSILAKMMSESPPFAQKQIIKITEDLSKIAKKLPVEHLINLLENLFWSHFIEQQQSNPKQSIKFIDETLLNLEHEDYHEFGMKLFAQLPLPALKQYGQDLLLRSFDHKSAGVRSGVTFAFDKIWNHDPQWGSKLLVNLIEEHMLKAKRIELLKLIQEYLKKDNEHIASFLDEKKLILAQHVAHLILNPQASNVELTKERFALGCTMIDILPPHAFFKEVPLIVHLALSQDTKFQEIGLRLIKGNAILGDIFRTNLGNSLMNELKSDQKFTAQGANVFNFHFAPPAGKAVPNNLNEYTLTKKVHQFPDFDQGLLPPQNPQTLIGPNVDDQSKTAGIGFAFNYGGKPYTSCKVDSNGWLKFEGNFSGSTYVNDTAYRGNNASMLFIWWQDLRTAHDGYLRTWMQGEEGHRIRVFEWRTFAVYTQSKSDNRTLNMQICLHEGSNKIVFRFGALEPRGNTNKSRTAVCGAKLGNNRTRTGNFRDFFGTNGTPPGSASPFRTNLRCDGKQKDIDYPGIIRDKAAEARFDAVVLKRYKRAMELLEEYCNNVLSALDLEEVSHLIHHPKKEIRDFGGRIIQIHNTHPDQYPSRLILELFMVQDKSLQKIRDEVIEKLTITGLQNHRSIWLKFIASNVQEHRTTGEAYIDRVLTENTDYHMSLLKELFALCNAQISGSIFLGGHKKVFERLIADTPRADLYLDEELLFDGYFSIHDAIRAYFIDIAHEALKNSRSMAFLFWDTLLQKQEEGSISEAQKTALDSITSIVDIHIQNIKGEDLRAEDWWLPRLTSPIRMVRATMAPLLGIYAQSYPALAIECAQKLLETLRGQVLREQVDGAPPKYDNLRGRAAIEALCTQFPDDKRVDYCSFWLKMFLHLHPEIRERGKVQLLQLLTDTASDSDYKRVLDMLLRQLLKKQQFEGAIQQVISFIRINISSRLYLVSERVLFRLLDSREELACSFGIHLMRQKFSADRISLEKMILLSGYDFVEVRRYAWELMEASIHRFREDFAQTIRFLEVKWEDTRQLAFNICREHLLDSWDIENIIRVCDSVRDDVRNFGLEQLRIFVLGTDHAQQSWSNGDQDTLTELARRLSQHPSIEVEAFLMKLFQEHEEEAIAPPLLNHPEQLTLLTPCFKRIFSRVNKARPAKDKLWTLVETRALEDQAKAQSLYPLLSWLSGTHLKKDKFKAIALMLSMQLKFPDLSFSKDQHHLIISKTSSPKIAK